MQYIYSDSFIHIITSTYGTKGAEWLAQLPTLIERCAKRWNLVDLRPFEQLTYNYVLFGMQQEVPVVLKLRCSVVELCKEIAALTAFQRHGGVKLLAYDEQLGALLLEQAIPGNMLSSYIAHDDSKATFIAAKLVQELHRAHVTSNFPLLEDVLPDLRKEFEQLTPFLDRARALRSQLFASQQHKILLHGDFHHGNILSAGDNLWMVIDPEGIIGDPVYDLAIFIRNPLKELLALPNAQEIVMNRMYDLSKLLGYCVQRIYDWTYLQAVCSAYWSLEDGLDTSNHVKFLQMLTDLKI